MQPLLEGGGPLWRDVPTKRPQTQPAVRLHRFHQPPKAKVLVKSDVVRLSRLKITGLSIRFRTIDDWLKQSSAQAASLHLGRNTDHHHVPMRCRNVAMMERVDRSEDGKESFRRTSA